MDHILETTVLMNIVPWTLIIFPLQGMFHALSIFMNCVQYAFFQPNQKFLLSTHYCISIRSSAKKKFVFMCDRGRRFRVNPYPKIVLLENFINMLLNRFFSDIFIKWYYLLHLYYIVFSRLIIRLL